MEQENYILLTPISENRMQDLVSRLAESYTGSGMVNEIDIEQHRTRPDTYRLLFPWKPDFDRFGYFVNYLKFPDGQPQDALEVYGYWNLQDANPKNLRGQRAMLHIAPPSEEFPDCIYATTDQDTAYRLYFAGDVTPLPAPAEAYHEAPIGEYDWQPFITIVTQKRATELEVPEKGCAGILIWTITLGSAACTALFYDKSGIVSTGLSLFCIS